MNCGSVSFLAIVFVSIFFGFINAVSDSISDSSSYIEVDKKRYLAVPKNALIASISDFSDFCALKCIRMSSCLSLNVATETNKNGMVLCGLLSTNKYEHSTQLQSSESFHHYTIVGTCEKKRTAHPILGCDPTSCAEILKQGYKTSGVYKINPDGQGSFSVYCDMETDGGGWTVLQRRQDGSVEFYRGWDDYKNGFGSLEGEFWLGNEKIHRLTASIAVEVRFDLEDFEGNRRFATYKNFNVLDEKNKYKVSIGVYNGTAGNSFVYHNGMAFTTMDRDNDIHKTNCAVVYKGAWWYKDCHGVNINGRYEGGNTSSYATGVVWNSFRGHYYSLKKTEMKIRPE